MSDPAPHAPVTTASQSNVESDLSSRAVSGAAWTMIGYVGSQVLRLVSNLVLTRLLFEEAFGLMALMQVILQGFYLLSDIGIGPSLIHNERVDARFVHTGYTVSVLRGALLFGLGWALTGPIADFYGEPLLRTYLPFVVFTALLNGLESTKVHTLNRVMRLERVQLMRLLTQLAGTITTIVWALIHPSIWALIAGVLVMNTSKVVMTHVYLPGPRDGFAWDRAALRSFLTYGSWTFLGTLFSFLSEQSDRLIFGKLISLDLLGVYSIAVIIATLPFSGLAQLAWKVLFPYFSRLGPAGERFAQEYGRVRQPLFVLGGWALSGLVAGGITAVEILYDSRYHAAGWMVQVLAVAVWFQLISVTNDAVAWGRGRPRLASIASLSKLVVLAALIPTGYRIGASIAPEHAFMGAVVGVALSDVVRYVVSMLLTLQLGVSPVRQDAQFTALVVASGVGGAWLDSVLRGAGSPPLLTAGAIFVAVSAAWAPLAAPLLADRWRRRRARAGGA